MNKPYPFEELRQLIEQNQSVSIFLPTNPQFDQVASALALKLALEKKGKMAAVLSPSPATVEFSQLVGVDTIGEKNEFGQNLVITLDYPLAQIEKVSYNDNGGKLNLIVQPKTGSPPLQKNQAVFSYEGGNKSLQIVLGVTDLSALGSLADQIDSSNLVTLSRMSGGNFGKLNIFDPKASCCSEMVAAILFNLGFMVDEDIAGNLYLGLSNATRNFSSDDIGPGTFEAAAVCLRWGAKKSVGFVTRKPVFEGEQRPAQKHLPPKPIRNVSSPPSPDWLEPKIFKSSNI